jgi:valyl-tRNA synthetase
MPDLAKPALEVVMNDRVKFYPANVKNSYKHWMENVRDWCISRQLWWGQRIPAYYLEDGRIVVARTKEEALEKAIREFDLPHLRPDDLRQDEDVLDTWFSSWLWPISTFDGIRNPDNADINYYYPTNDLVTAPDILFFWVARMIMSGLEYRNEVPFRNVYFTGMVRDKLGRKMSKSLGNSPDPMELMDKFGADGVRVGMLLMSPAGNDLLFDEALCEQGRNFSNKIWNALRLVSGWKIDEGLDQSAVNEAAVNWFSNRFNDALALVEDHFSKFRISDALMAVYKLVWDEFCSWYLEMVKPEFGKAIDQETYSRTIAFFEDLMKMLHPFMPFITEEIWHRLDERQPGDDIIIAPYPESGEIDKGLLKRFEYEREVVIAIRNERQGKNIPPREKIHLYIKKNHDEVPNTYFDPILMKLGNVEQLEYVEEKVENAASFIVAATEFYIPLSESVDVEAELEKMQKELDYTRGFLATVMKKLENERFVANAPEKVIELERKKQNDARKRIQVLEEQIAAMKK